MTRGVVRLTSSGSYTPAAAKPGLPECGSEAMLRALAEIPIIARVLSSTRLLPQQQSVREHITRVLRNFDQYLARTSSMKRSAEYNDGMRAAAIVSCVARELARELNDPYMAPVLANELIEVYKVALQNVLRAERAKRIISDLAGPNGFQGRFDPDFTDPAITFAQAIVGIDPITLHLQQKISQRKAAEEIRRVAASAGRNAASICSRLVEQFQIEIGAFDSDQIKDKEPDDILKEDSISGTPTVMKASFDLADLYGEISTRFFRQTVALDPNGKPRWRKSIGCLTKPIREKIKALTAEVRRPQFEPAALSSGELDAERLRTSALLTTTELTHFANIRSMEAQELLTKYEDNPNCDVNQEDVGFLEQSRGRTPEEFVLAQISMRYELGTAQGLELKDAIIEQLQNIPLTVSCDASKMFRERTDHLAVPFHGTKYRNRQVLAVHEYKIRDIFGDPAIAASKTVASIGHPTQDYVERRGINYMRWRREKDERETGFHNLDPGDLPVFGAINPNFDQLVSRELKSVVQSAEKLRSHGVNYYGDIHFVLKEHVRCRSMFIARGATHLRRFRIERINLLLLLADMFRLSMHEYLDALVAATQGSRDVFVAHMEGEVHVYGGLDLARDVKEVYVPANLLAEIEGPGERLRTFAERNGIMIRDIGGSRIWIKSPSKASVQPINREQPT